MKDIKHAQRSVLELSWLSLLAACYYSFISGGRLCRMLTGGESIIHRFVLAALLTSALVIVVVVLYLLVQRVGKADGLKNIICCIFEIKATAFVYVLIMAKLFQAFYYRIYIPEENGYYYYISRSFVVIYVAAIILSYIGGCAKFRKAQVYSTVVCFLGWLMGRIVIGISGLYRFVYYCTVLLSTYYTLCYLIDFSLKCTLTKIKRYLFSLNPKRIIVYCMVVVVGACVGFISAYSTGETIYCVRCAFWSAALLCITKCFFLYKEKERFVEKAFLCIILTIGILLAVFMPLTTGVSWDDQIHYSGALDVIQAGFLTEADVSMAYIEEGPHGNTTSLLKTREYYNALREKSGIVASRGTGYVSSLFQRISYIPNALGLCISQILLLPYGISFIMGRVSGLLFYAFVVYAAMQRLKSGKLLLAVIALLPTNLFQACSYSYDAWIVCLVAYAMAIFIGNLQNACETIESKNVFEIAIVMALAIAPKGIYFPLLMLFLIMPATKFSNKLQQNRYLLTILVTMVCCFVAYMLLPFVGGRYSGDTRFGEEISATGQIVYILTHPISYLKTITCFMRQYLSLENTFGHTSFMAYLGGSDYHATLTVLLFVSALIDRNKEDQGYNTVGFKIVGTLVPVIAAVLIATVMYLSCTPVGADYIDGCQPRYLAPLVFPFLILCCNFGYFKPKHHEGIAAIILSLSGYVACVCVWSNVILRYIP